MHLCYPSIVKYLLDAKSRNAMRTADMYEADTVLSCALLDGPVSEASKRDQNGVQRDVLVRKSYFRALLKKKVLLKKLVVESRIWTIEM